MDKAKQDAVKYAIERARKSFEILSDCCDSYGKQSGAFDAEAAEGAILIATGIMSLKIEDIANAIDPTGDTASSWHAKAEELQ